MKTVRDLVDVDTKVGDIGIEIEIEANNLPEGSAVNKYWRREVDNSLRGESAEYVFRNPLKVNNLEKAFGELEDAFKKHNTTTRSTYRAGVHVHVNVQELTARQLITFIASYLLLEEVFLSFCEKSRSGNHFCLRASDAGYILDRLTAAISEQKLQALQTDDIRYASINFTSLFRYGSVEFRALESTTDFKRIELWASALNQLKVFATTVASPTDLMYQASSKGFTVFTQDILGPYYNDFAHLVTEERIKTGVRNIQYSLFSCKWDSVNLNIFSKKNIF